MATRRRGIAVGLLASTVIAGAGLALWWQGAQAEPAPFPLHAHVPADATQLIWIDHLADLVNGIQGIAADLRGAERLPEAAALLVALPHFDLPTLSAAGFEPEAGLALWQSGGDLWGVTRVADDAAADHVADVLRRRGHEVEARPTGPTPGSWWRVARRGEPGRVQAELRLLNHVLLLRWHLQAPAAALLGAAHAAGPAPAQGDAAFIRHDAAERLPAARMATATGQVHARLQSLAELGVHKLARAAIGPAVLLFGRLIDGLQRAELDLDLRGEALALAVRLLSAPGATKATADYHQAFLPEGTPPLELASLLPDEVALLLRARLNPALLAMVPAILRDRLLPASSLSQIHPALAALDAHALLLDQLDGQVAVGLLGVDDEAPADPRLWPARGLRRTVSGFVAVSLRTDQAAQGLLHRVQTVLREAGVAVTSRQVAGFTGVSVAVGPAPWTALRKGRSLIWISGAGEIERFERVAKGRFANLAAAATSALERDLASGRGHWIGGLITTGRIARSLRRRGVPAHFVRMVADVACVATALRLHPDGVNLNLSLRPQKQAEQAP